MAGKIKLNIFKNREFLGIPAVFFILCLLIGIVFISIVHFQMETESQKRNIRKNAEMLANTIEGKIFLRQQRGGIVMRDRDFIRRKNRKKHGSR